jgi:sterol desaturase/sphingolipid hydroxylase (fatty acid hydroxylase superfamily)
MMNFALPTPPLFLTVWVALMIAYHGIGLWFSWLDRTGGLSRFKTRPVERRPYFEILPRVLFNQTFILLPAMGLAQCSGLAFVGSDHMSLLAAILTLAAMALGHDVVQYVLHRWLLHRPDVMNRLGHAVHHSTTASSAISACYMSAADFLVEIVLPYLIPLALVGAGSNMTFHVFSVTAGVFGGLYEHSGYDFSLPLARARGNGAIARAARAVAPLMSSRAHGEHHSRGNVSFSDGFGSTSLCDILFRTRWDLVRGKTRRREKHQAPATVEGTS